MKFELRRLLDSFRYALQGIWHCVRRERNFRIHLTAAFYALLLAFWMGLSTMEWAILLLTIAVVLAAELLNTALEALVNQSSPQRTPGGNVAKDTAAGAVLCCAVASIGVGVALFWRPPQLKALLAAIQGDWRLWLFLAVSVLLACVFVFGPQTKKERE